MTHLDRLKEQLFGDPQTAISDIKFFPPESDEVTVEDIAETVLQSIEDIQAGGGRDVDLSV